MTRYNSLKLPTLLQEHDELVFELDGEKYTYTVQDNYLDFNEGWGDNDTILVKLGLDSEDFVTKCYGYEPFGGDWPCYRSNDYEAATRVALAVFGLCISRSGVPKATRIPLTKQEQEVVDILKDGSWYDEDDTVKLVSAILGKDLQPYMRG